MKTERQKQKAYLENLATLKKACPFCKVMISQNDCEKVGAYHYACPCCGVVITMMIGLFDNEEAWSVSNENGPRMDTTKAIELTDIVNKIKLPCPLCHKEVCKNDCVRLEVLGPPWYICPHCGTILSMRVNNAQPRELWWREI